MCLFKDSNVGLSRSGFEHPTTWKACAPSLRNRRGSYVIKLVLVAIFSMKSYIIIFGLLVWVFRPTWEFFTHMETLPLPMKGCNFMTYIRHSLPLSSEGSLACYTYCNTGLPFTWSPVVERLAGQLSYQSHQNHILLESLRFGAILRRSDCLFLRLNILSRPGIEARSSACEANVRPTAVAV